MKALEHQGFSDIVVGVYYFAAARGSAGDSLRITMISRSPGVLTDVLA